MKKTESFEEWYKDVLFDAEIVDSRYPVKGMYAWKPYGFKILKNIIRLSERLLEENGHQEVYFPMLISERIFGKEKDFLEGFKGESYIVTHAGQKELEEKLVVRPTSETVMYYFFSLWIKGYRQLPLKVYQTVNVFRYETKMTKPLLRVREIVKFQEAHTVHKTKEEAEKQIEEAKKIYMELFDLLLIPYVVLKTPSWDTFAGALYNYDFFTIMPDGKAIELASVINLGQKFSRAFNIMFLDENEEKKYAYQTCYGISERLMGAMISVLGDDVGLRLPSIVAPIKVVIVPILFKGKEEVVLKKARNIKEKLSSKFEVVLDDSEKSPGEKFYYWETKGVPIRVEIGPKEAEAGEVTIVRRDNKERQKVKEERLVEIVEKELKNYDSSLREKVRKSVFSKIREFEDIEKAKESYKKNRGIVAVPWCGNDECGEKLETLLEIPALGEKIINKKGKCPVCGKETNKFLYFGRTY